MRAPFNVIMDTLEFESPVRPRIEVETRNGGTCFLYHCRGKYADVVHAIREAQAPLGITDDAAEAA